MALRLRPHRADALGLPQLDVRHDLRSPDLRSSRSDLPFSPTEISAGELTAARVRAFRAWWMLVISLQPKPLARRRLFFMTALQTSAGSFDASRRRLVDLLGRVTRVVGQG